MILAHCIGKKNWQNGRTPSASRRAFPRRKHSRHSTRVGCSYSPAARQRPHEVFRRPSISKNSVCRGWSRGEGRQKRMRDRDRGAAAYRSFERTFPGSAAAPRRRTIPRIQQPARQARFERMRRIASSRLLACISSAWPCRARCLKTAVFSKSAALRGGGAKMCGVDDGDRARRCDDPRRPAQPVVEHRRGCFELAAERLNSATGSNNQESTMPLASKAGDQMSRINDGTVRHAPGSRISSGPTMGWGTGLMHCRGQTGWTICGGNAVVC
jgi:hypothetical protein